MGRGSFMINGVDSSEMGLFFQSRPDILLPKSKSEALELYGGDGVILFDDPSYEEVEYEWDWLMASVNGVDREEGRLKLHKLFMAKPYTKIIPYFDPHKVWEVRLLDVTRFINWYYMGEHQSIKLKVSVKPYKRLVENANISFTTSNTFLNPTNYTALPLIKITGSGDVTLTVNGVGYVIKNIVDHIYLDCNLEQAYRENQSVLMNENSKINAPEFPVLKPGYNSITASKTVAITVTPNWRSLL